MPKEIGEKTMFFKAGWSDLGRQLKCMDDCGIEMSLLLYPTSDAHLNMGGWKNLCAVYNQEIAQAVKAHPARFVGAGIMPIDEPGAIGGELKRVRELGLKAISLASSYEGKYLSDEVFFSIYEFAAKHKMPIHVHPQIISPIGEDRVKDPLLTPVLQYVFDVSMAIGKLMMEGTFLKFPETIFIFAHYGGVLPLVKERFDNTYLMLRNREFVKDLKQLPSAYFKNLYFDTSGSRSVGSLQCALEITDAGHILYGSDFPANQDMVGSIRAIESSPLTKLDSHGILNHNFRKCLFL